MAIRGRHISHIMRELGLHAVTRVAAKANPHRRKDRKGAKRVEKERLIEVIHVRLPDGTTKLLQLYARGGAAGIVRHNEAGESVFESLPRVRTQRVAAKGGWFRWYSQHRLPHDYGGGLLTIRYHEDTQDQQRGLNRAENLRAIPPTDPDFRSLYARRNDAESINRALEDTLYLGRAHSVGSVRQQTDLLGWGLLINARTLARHRSRGRARAAA